MLAFKLQQDEPCGKKRTTNLWPNPPVGCVDLGGLKRSGPFILKLDLDLLPITGCHCWKLESLRVLPYLIQVWEWKSLNLYPPGCWKHVAYVIPVLAMIFTLTYLCDDVELQLGGGANVRIMDVNFLEFQPGTWKKNNQFKVDVSRQSDLSPQRSRHPKRPKHSS